MSKGHYRLIRASAVKVDDVVMLARTEERIADAQARRSRQHLEYVKVRTHNAAKVDAVFTFGSRVIVRGYCRLPAGRSEHHCLIFDKDDYLMRLLGYVQNA